MELNGPSKEHVGPSGEFYVASFLSAHNLCVGLPRGGAARFDLVVAHESGAPSLLIQVKSGTQSRRKDKDVGSIFEWQTGKKSIDDHDKYFWYAFVWLNGWPEAQYIPRVFFVPSRRVSDCVQEEFRRKGGSWLSFWIRESDAEQYEGTQGLMAMLQSLAFGPPSG